MFINYAHRGASQYAPENTMSAFKKALDLKANRNRIRLAKDEGWKNRYISP